MSRLQRVLVGLFLFVLLAGTILLTIYNDHVSRDLADALIDRQVKDGMQQVDHFREDLQESLEKYGFMQLIEETRGDFLEFEELSERLLNQNRYISYVHWKDDHGETLLYKGPRNLHQITINKQGVAYYSSTTGTVREIIVERAGEIEDIADVTTPVQAEGQPVGSLSVGFSKDRIVREGRETLDRLRRRTLWYGGVALSLLGIGFLFTMFQVRRVDRLQRRLQRSQQLADLGTMASGLVHEIRNPINGVNLNLHLIEDEIRAVADPSLSRRVEELMERIRPSMSHLECLANEFLRYARPPKLVFVEDDLNEVLRLVAAFLKPQSVQAGIRIDLDLDDAVGSFPLDREILKQVILNFAMNALQVMEHGASMTLRTRDAGREVFIEVEDEGPGLDVEAAARIFELFYSTREGGAGLGLPIARRLVQSHGGRVECHSQPGEGTVMRVVLPRTPPEADGEAGGEEKEED